MGFAGNFSEPEFSADIVESGIALYCHLEPYDGRFVERWDLAHDQYRPDEAGADLISELTAKWSTATGETGAVKPKKPGRSPVAAEIAAIDDHARGGGAMADQMYSVFTSKLEADAQGKQHESERTSAWLSAIQEVCPEITDHASITADQWLKICEAAVRLFVPF